MDYTYSQDKTNRNRVMTNKTKFALGGVPKTLLLPLVGRAIFSNKHYSPIYDAKAIEIVNELDFDFTDLIKDKNNAILMCTMARVYHFDEAIKAYLAKYPDATIVNLGCGLDTTYHRVNNGRLTWVDIDLPDVIALRREILPPSDHQQYIAKSALDYSWIDDVKKLNDHVFIFAGGLFLFFKENEVKDLFTHLAKTFPDGELIFDNCAPHSIKSVNKNLAKSGMQNAKITWGVKDGKSLEKWSPHIKLISQHSYFNGINTKKFPLWQKMKIMLYNLTKSTIIHLKFI